ncbi:MAG: hypothetical protein K9G24_10555 [Candidatus Nanopelagicales bacterium]|nr:hypothetical protein [Candidatus Nanopelagicales bacterium]MCF8543510.1 hypothetical protein [Candidatus Nanopelagicales bacterium]
MRDVLQVVLGPWPMSPWLILVMVMIVVHVTNLARFAGDGPLVPTNLSGAPASVATGAAFALTVWASNHLRSTRSRPLTRTWYLSTVIVGAVVTTTVRISLLGLSGIEATYEPEIVLQMLLRFMLLGLVICAIAGVNNARLTAQVDRAEAALALVSEQRAALFQAEETARSSVSHFLHDRVQASLVAVGMQMRQVSTGVGAVEAGRLGSLVEEIERIRTQDVREAARLLSPDFETLGIEGALRELARTYAPATSIRVTSSLDAVTGGSMVSGHLSAAIYRTVEQAMLNSVTHGQARSVTVSLAAQGQQVVVTVQDDGSGLPVGPIGRGAGSLFMDSATQSVGGSWTLEPADGGGAVMRALFPLHHPSERRDPGKDEHV